MDSVKKNILWNLMGNVLPLLAGVLLFPLIIEAYGVERFGLLTLAWALVGYFGLFDFGLSRALTQQVSALIAKGGPGNDVAELIRTALRLMLCLGTLGGLVLYLSTPGLVTDVLKISSLLESEAISSFLILSFSIPLVVHTAGLRGILESLHVFKALSLIRVLMGVGTFLGPYIASRISPSLEAAIYSLVIVRALVWIMHYLVVMRSGILSPTTPSFNRVWIHGLLRFGGWLTLSNLIGPFMVYLDRFVIVSMLGVASVSYYVVPYEVVTKLWVVPAAITGVLFPLFARHSAVASPQLVDILDRGARYITILLLPVCLVLAYGAHQWLSFWLGDTFSEKSSGVATWLLAGVLINSAAQVVYAKVQGVGRSDLTAKLHLLELIPYLLLLWALLHNYGIIGAAIAWCLRVTIDFLGLVWIVYSMHPSERLRLHSLAAFVLLASALIILVGLPNSVALGTLFFIVAMTFTSVVSFRLMRRDGILNLLRGYLKLKK